MAEPFAQAPLRIGSARGSRTLLPACLFAACGALASACGADDPEGPRILHPRQAGPADTVVAHVDGVPILGSRVALAASELGITKAEALDGMIEMTLLALEAERRGLAAEPDVGRMWKKAMVQALLAREVESRVDSDSVTQDDVRAFYAANYKDRGILLEDAWRDIWSGIVIDRRHAKYLELTGRARSHASVVINDQNVFRYLGGSVPAMGSQQAAGEPAQAGEDG